jgi:hypothetical protein
VSSCHDCGHTDKEHEDMQAIKDEVFNPVNISLLISSMPNEALMATMQFAVAELFVRGKSDDEFLNVMRSLDEGAKEVFIEKDDEFRAHARKARAAFSTQVENDEFMEGAGAELASILDEHGVMPEDLAPTTQPEVADDFWPGQYL